MTALLAGLAFGLVGSGHCAAMCGPLVLLANPRPAGLGTGGAVSRSTLAVHAALYHGGRGLTYLGLGLLVGVAGSGLARLGLGRALAVVAGAALVLQALAAARVVSATLASHRLGAIVTRALGRAGAWMRTHRMQGPIVFGALNGLLPCGMLYAALTAAAGFGDAGQALVFMGAFAVGTTPVLALLGVTGGALTSRVPIAIRRAAPVALAIVGVLLIVRGIRAPHADHAAHAMASPHATAAPGAHAH
jgi:sulfite exporter TauE/SafE